MTTAPRRPAAAPDAPDVSDAPDAPHWRWDGEDLRLEIQGKPGARRDAFGRVAGGRLAVQIAAVAEGGKANARLLRFLADAFGVAASAVEIVHGATSPKKQLRIRAPKRLPDAAGVGPRSLPSPQTAQVRKPAKMSSRQGGK